MGTATNSPSVMAQKKSSSPEANWLAVPDFRGSDQLVGQPLRERSLERPNNEAIS